MPSPTRSIGHNRPLAIPTKVSGKRTLLGGLYRRPMEPSRDPVALQLTVLSRWLRTLALSDTVLATRTLVQCQPLQLSAILQVERDVESTG